MKKISSLRAPESYYSKEDLEKADKIIREKIDIGTSVFEISLITKDGRKIPTEYKTSIIKDREAKASVCYFSGKRCERT